MLDCYTFSSLYTSEHGGQCSHLNHILPPVQSDATGQTAEQGGGHQDSAVDLHQVLPGEIVTSANKHLSLICNISLIYNIILLQI